MSLRVCKYPNSGPNDRELSNALDHVCRFQLEIYQKNLAEFRYIYRKSINRNWNFNIPFFKEFVSSNLIHHVVQNIASRR